MLVNKDKIKLNSKAHQKLCTWKPLTNFSANKTIKALIANKNRPKVNTVMGIVSTVNIGFAIVLAFLNTIVKPIL